MTDSTAETSPVIYARIAGFLYLIIILSSIFNETLVRSNLVVSGDAATTASNIMASEWLFRWVTASDLIMFAGVVLLSLALYVILKTVSKNLALLALCWRLVEATLGCVTVLCSFIVLLLLNGENYSTALETERLQALAGLFLDVRTAGMDMVIIFCGLGSIVFCYLFFKSRYVPRILAAWGVLSYLLITIYPFVNFLLPNRTGMPEIVVYAPGTLFEVIFGLWLLFKGIRIPDRES
jgi:hypothetical protein